MLSSTASEHTVCGSFVGYGFGVLIVFTDSSWPSARLSPSVFVAFGFSRATEPARCVISSREPGALGR